MSEKQKFKEYRRAIKKGLRIFTKENSVIFLLAVLVVGVWYFYFVKYGARATGISLFEKDALLKVVFFDVGQGDSALITTPGGKNILIDTGSLKGATIEESEEGSLITEVDSAESVILPYMAQNNITKIDALIVTHPHVDHFGGAFKIIDAVPVGLFVDNGVAVANPYLEGLLKKVKKKKIKYFSPSSGIDYLPLKEGKDLEIRFLTIPTIFTAKDNSAINNTSLVIKLRYKNFTALFTGDIEMEAEMELLNWKKELRSTVLKVAHHGSQTSSSLPFLDMVAPSVAVISCGRGNPYGHPHETVIARLNAVGAKVLRTDEKGSIAIITDGKKYIYEIMKK